TLISKSKPYSHVTPTAVSVGCGAWPQYSGTIFQIVSNLDAGSTMNTVTSTTSSNVLPAAVRIAFRLSNARRTWVSRSGSFEPSSRLPTWPDTNRKPLDRIAGEYRLRSYSAWRPSGKTTSRVVIESLPWAAARIDHAGTLRTPRRAINGQRCPSLFVKCKQ